MAMLQLEINDWAQENFGACQLGDVRRTRRAVKLAAQVAARPDGSTPEQTEAWPDCKAAYRLFDRDEVTFDALCEPHWELTRNRDGGTWLLLGDTTEIDFRIQREISGLGPTGDGKGRGFFLHSSLMIDADTGEIAGLAGAELFHRKPAPKGETRRQQMNRERESEVWGRVIDRVGTPPEGAHFIHVFDAGADNFEVFCHLQIQKCGWVIQAAHKHRRVFGPEGDRLPLQALIDRQPVSGMSELSLRSRKQASGTKQSSRTALLEVRHAPLTMPIPKTQTPFVQQCGIKRIPMWVIDIREVDAPADVKEPLHWVLLTSEPVQSFDDARTVIGWYEKRPVIEDYHKCLKTGCRVEERQYETSERLEAVTGMLSVVAIRLLQLKYVARSEPNVPAKRVVPPTWLEMLQAVQRGKRQIRTVRDFFRSLAMLGGFLGRKSDGEPG
ncbi:Transposase for transposon Tn5 [Maioricimonas rarisocia]|nr:IS4 family transposase [Maioricimonas rarisocia]QDU36550.1 Transposase for transposon Tn5 [Maioricimonas rarisocia]